MEKYPEKLMMCVNGRDTGCGNFVKIGKIYRIIFRPFRGQEMIHRQIVEVYDKETGVAKWAYLDAFIDIPHGEK
jgi:hypothetical protein